jgi:hypothetical protein
MNTSRRRVEKFRLTQDLSFSLGDTTRSFGQREGQTFRLYPEMVYGWCMPRILHLVAALREEHPGIPLFICGNLPRSQLLPVNVISHCGDIGVCASIQSGQVAVTNG